MDSVIARSSPGRGLPATGQEAGLTGGRPVPHTPPQLPRSCIRKAAALGQTGAAQLRWPCQHQDRVRLLRGPARGRDGHRPCVPAMSPSSSAAEAGARLNTCSYYAAHALLRENQWMFQPLLTGTSSTGDGRRRFSAREASSLTSRPPGMLRQCQPAPGASARDQRASHPDGGGRQGASSAGRDAPDHRASPASSASRAAAWSGGIRPGPKNVPGTLSLLLLFSIFSKATCMLFQ